jgi:hypothetical protein
MVDPQVPLTPEAHSRVPRIDTHRPRIAATQPKQLRGGFGHQSHAHPSARPEPKPPGQHRIIEVPAWHHVTDQDGAHVWRS